MQVPKFKIKTVFHFEFPIFLYLAIVFCHRGISLALGIARTSFLYSCPHLFTSYSRIVYSYVDLVCFVPLFIYLFIYLFHITTRHSYMNNHGIRHNTLGAVDYLNTPLHAPETSHYLRNTFRVDTIF